MSPRIPESVPTYRSMVWDRDVMRAVPGSGQADVTSALPRDFISELAKRLDEILPRETTWDPHAAITISFTMCSRITLGI